MSATRSLIAENFEAFYAELLRQKAKVLKATHDLTAEQLEDPVLEKLCVQVQRRLMTVIREQATRIELQGNDLTVLNHQEAQYIMAALADETFLGFNWGVGRRAWEQNLIEAQLFYSQTAGEQFFARLERLIEANDPTRRDLAEVFLLALGVGFLGRYRDRDDGGALQRYRTQLFHVLNQRAPTLDSGQTMIMPTAYENRAMPQVRRLLPDIQVWSSAVAAVSVLYVLFAYIIWHQTTAEIRTLTSSIILQTSGEAR